MPYAPKKFSPYMKFRYPYDGPILDVVRGEYALCISLSCMYMFLYNFV